MDACWLLMLELTEMAIIKIRLKRIDVAAEICIELVDYSGTVVLEKDPNIIPGDTITIGGDLNFKEHEK